MTAYDLEHLLATVEEVRSTVHPEIPAALLAAVVRAEDQFPEDDDAALRAIGAAVAAHLEEGA